MFNLNQVSGFGPDVMYYLSRLSGSKILLNIHPTDSYGWDPAAVMTEAYNWQKDFDSDLIIGWQANDLRKAETYNVRESATGSEPKFNKINNVTFWYNSDSNTVRHVYHVQLV